MYQKFIITGEGILRFGRVYMHRDLLRDGEMAVYGGGLWKIDHGRDILLLYGRSFDFGTPYCQNITAVDWDSLDGYRRDIFYMPHWPDEDQLIPVASGLQHLIPDES